ncbi:hypothetical protein Q8A67_018755 [Cirrhinus molitorella]|uniref:Uncharacterized protein n=1 Tax=Cirrhinus molitorella TaxID=172907 RepID=A0AA88TGE5_9TELE|nr:hypothetical protein Q8A67_018755 [Cirrhinus molitorella]
MSKRSVSCPGKPHTEAALTEMECSHCVNMTPATLHARIAFISGNDSAPPVFFLPETYEEKRIKCLVQIPHALPLPSREDSPILFELSNQHPSADASNMVSFGVELLDDSMSLIASNMEDMSGSTTDPAPLLSANPSNAKPGICKSGGVGISFL